MASNRPPSSLAQFLSNFEPAVLLFWSLRYSIGLILETIFINRDPASLFQTNKIRDEAFSRFWLKFTEAEPPPIDKLEGSAAIIPPLLSTAHGKILELGPGSGYQTRYYDPAKVSHIYTAEPNKGLHKQLLIEAEKAGVSNRYTALTCGAEEEGLVKGLEGAGVKVSRGDDAGVFDTIVCVRVLCGVSDPVDTIAGLFRLLKRGGELLICEHVVNPGSGKKKGSTFARAMQGLYMLMGWKFIMGGCEMDRNTERNVFEAGKKAGSGWSASDVDYFFTWSALPYACGKFVK